MNKSDFHKAIATASGMSAKEVDNVMEGLAAVTKDALGKGHEVTIQGVAKLGTKVRAARKGRNPSTGAPLDIPAKTMVDVKVLKPLADHVAS